MRSADVSRRREMKEHWKHEIIMSGLDLKEKHMGFKETGLIQAAGIIRMQIGNSFEYTKPMGRILYICVCECVFAWMWLCVWRWSHSFSDQCSTSDNLWLVHTHFLHYKILRLWKDSDCDDESKSQLVNCVLWDHSGLGWTAGVSSFVRCTYASLLKVTPPAKHKTTERNHTLIEVLIGRWKPPCPEVLLTEKQLNMTEQWFFPMLKYTETTISTPFVNWFS